MTSDQDRTYDTSALAIVAFDLEARSRPPSDQYAALVDVGNGPQWSLGMNILQDWDGDEWTKLAEVDFVVDEAPHDELVRGAKFALYEGPERVGHLVVTKASSRVAASDWRDSREFVRERREAA